MTGLTYFEIAQGQAFERCAFGAAAAAVERSQKRLSEQRRSRIDQAAAKLVVLDALRRVAELATLPSGDSNFWPLGDGDARFEYTFTALSPAMREVERRVAAPEDDQLFVVKDRGIRHMVV